MWKRGGRTQRRRFLYKFAPKDRRQNQNNSFRVTKTQGKTDFEQQTSSTKETFRNVCGQKHKCEFVQRHVCEIGDDGHLLRPGTQVQWPRFGEETASLEKVVPHQRVRTVPRRKYQIEGTH